MANTSSTHVIKVTDNGTLKATTKEAEGLNSALEKAARTAGKVSQARAAGPAFAANARGRQDGEDSGTARGIGGLTGAAGRDFAKQSEGLGGLVRLYATFAANIFAATAAFGALSKAADTTNMVKGLDQLGVASGKNLGSLSKKVVEVTDYAISMREAMESVAKASAAGLDSTQILAMSDAAKKASQALGVDMGDAISRLTRGISKLEPELLDELGLFTKVDKSTQDYARSVGKATSSLTDFERRQAFANAVLAEAKQKFSVIDIPANPYSKLLASFKDISQVALELVNKVLGPLVKLLAESPTALAGVMAGIAALLLKTAIPAIGSWREGLKGAAVDAAKTAKAFTDSFDDKFNDRLNASFRIPGLEKNLERATKAADVARTKLTTLAIPSSLSKVASVSKFIDDPDSPENKAGINRLIKYKESQLAKDLSGTKVLTAVKKQQIEEELNALNKVIAAKKLLSIEDDKRIAAARALNVAQAGAQGTADKPLGRFDPQTLAANKARSLENIATKSRLVSLAAEDAAILGVRGSMRSLNAEIAKEGLTGWNKYSTVARGALAATSTRVFGLIGSLGKVGVAIGIAVAAFEVLSAIFGKNAKQVAEFDSAVVAASSSAELMGKTLANNAKQMDFGISIRGITALASAFKEVSNSVTELTTKFKLAEESAGWFDIMVDSVKFVFGKSLQQTYAKTVSASIIAGLEGINSPEAKKKAEERIKTLLKITDVSKSSLDKVDSSKLAAAGKELGSILTEAGMEADAASLNIINYSENIGKASKAYDELSASLNDNTAFGKVGAGFVETGFAIAKTTGDMRTNFAALIDVAEDASKLRFLPAEAQKQLLDFLPKLKESRALLGANSSALIELQKIIDGEDKLNSTVAGRSNLGNKERATIEAAKAAKVIVTEQSKSVDAIRDRMVDMTNTISAAMVEAGEKMLDKALIAAKEVARINYLRSVTSGMSGVGTATVQANLKQEEISTQLKVISAMEELTIATLKTGLTMQAFSLNEDRKSSDEGVRSKAEKLSTVVDTVQQLVGTLNSKQLQDYYNTLKNTDGVLKAMLFPFVKAFKESTTQRTKLGGDSKVTEDQKLQGIKKEQVELEREREQSVFNQKTSLAEINKLTTYQNGALAESVLLAQQKDSIELNTLANTRERVALDAKIAEAKDRLDKLLKDNTSSTSTIDAARANFKTLTDTIPYLTKEQELRTAILKIQNKQALISNKFAKDKETTEYLQQEQDIRIKTADLVLEGQESELAYLSKIGAINEQNLINSTKELAVKKLTADKDAQILQINRDRASKLAVVSEAGQKADVGSNESDKQDNRAREAADIKKINDLADKGIELAKQQSAQKEKYLVLLSEEEARQLRFTEGMANLVSATESLATVFGNVGTALGTSLQSLMTFGQTQEKYDLAKAERDKKLKAASEGDQPEEYFKLKKEEATADKKNTKDQLTNMANVAGATKKLFSEKTLAHKALAATEKTLHLIRLGMDIKSIASDTIKTGKEILNAGARASMSGTEAVVDTLAAIPPPFGWVAAGITAAMVASLLGGKGPKVNMAGNTSADRQETQGTGMSWKDGKQVENGNGVFGDPTEKSDSVRKSLEIMKDNTIEGLKYDRSMLDALQSIDRAISGVSKGLAAIPGIRTGSSFGTQEGTVGKAGIYNLFGSKTSQEITDAGIKVTGIFSDLSKGMGSFLQYEDVLKTKTKSGLFGIGKSSSQSLTTNFKTLDDSLSAQITDIFKNATGLFNQVAKDMGKSATYVADVLAQLPVQMSASLKGLSGKDLEAAFNAVVSQQLDAASAALFSEMKKYAEFGEGLLETTVRVVDTNAKMKVAFDSIGITVANLSYDTSESLAELAGGLSEFNDGVKFFSQNFLTEAERLAPVQRNVSTTLAELATSFKMPAIAAISTREAFKELVLSLNPAEEQSAKLYSELIKLAPAFAETTPAIKDVVESLSKLLERANELQNQYDKLTISEDAYAAKLRSVYKDKELAQYDANIALEKEIKLLTERKELKSKFSDLEVDLLKAMGKEQEALTLSRSRELDKLNPANRKIQEMILARQDEISALNKLVTITASITSAMKSFVDAEKTAKDALDATKTALASTAQSLKSNMVDTLRQLTQASKDADQAVTDAKVALAQTAVELKSNIVTSLREFTQASKDADQAVTDARLALVQTALALRGSIVSALQEIRAAADSAAANLKSASDTIASSFLAARSAVEAADKGVASARDNIINSAQAAQQALNQAYFNVSQGLSQAEANLASANKEVANSIQASKDELRGLAKGIREFIFSISSTDLGANSQASQLDILKKEFDSQSRLALQGDKEALSKITGTAQSLLTLGKDQSKTSLEFAALTGTVSSTLDKIASATEATAGPAVDPGLVAQQSTAIAAAEVVKWQQALFNLNLEIKNKAGEDALNAAKLAAEASIKSLDPVVAAQEEAAKALLEVTNWQKALADSGITGVATQKDLLEEYKLAVATQTDARAELKAWEDVVLKAGVDTAISSAISATKASILVDTTKKAYDDWVLATTANKTAQADLITAIDATKDIPQKQLTALENLNKLLGDYFTITNVLTPGELIDPVTNILKDLNTSITNQKTASDNLTAATVLVAKIVGTSELSVTTQLDSLATLVADYRLIAGILTPNELVVSASNVLKDLNTSITNQKTATDNLALATSAVSDIITANDLLVKTDLDNLAKLVEDYRLIASVLSPQEMMGSVSDILKDYNTANGKWKTAYDELEAAKVLTATITTTAEVTALENLRKLVDDYNKEILIRDTARNVQSAAENVALITEVRALVTAIATPTTPTGTPTVPDTVAPPASPTNPGDFVGPIRPPGAVGTEPTAANDSSWFVSLPRYEQTRVADAWINRQGQYGSIDDYMSSVANGGMPLSEQDRIKNLYRSALMSGELTRPPGYASGGNFSGGYRIVGENGPELEATGPSRIFSNRQTNDMFNNTELIAEIKELRKEVAALRSTSVSTEYNTRKTNETFQQVTIGGQYMLTRAA